MHIPDGYLSPQTYIPLLAVTVTVIAVAVKKVRNEVSSKDIPYLGMAAAFSFIIMLFNLPIPGGTTGHAVGSAVIAILIGPWAAVIAVSVALVIQAVIFGDGGITAIGANCFNMAIFMPFISFYTFRLFARFLPGKHKLKISAFFSGYLGLVLTSVLTAFEFGIQPVIASSPTGQALYCPYGMGVAIPVMAAGHLLLFGIVEGAITSLIISYFFKNEPGLIYAFREGSRNEIN